MSTMTKTVAALAGAVALGLLLVQPAEAGDRGKKYRSHHHHHHFRGHAHGWHRGFIPGQRGHRSHRHAHRRPLVQFWYVPPPRTVVVRPYVPPPALSALPPQAWVPSMTCREYTRDVIIDGRPAAAYGRACLQPDGSWRIVAD